MKSLNQCETKQDLVKRIRTLSIRLARQHDRWVGTIDRIDSADKRIPERLLIKNRREKRQFGKAWINTVDKLRALDHSVREGVDY